MAVHCDLSFAHMTRYFALMRLGLIYARLFAHYVPFISSHVSFRCYVFIGLGLLRPRRTRTYVPTSRCCPIRITRLPLMLLEIVVCRYDVLLVSYSIQ